tara:strand:- start:36886 stop:38823 length:1938 start_codon:yes stop_codon:yes gene_type:complete
MIVSVFKDIKDITTAPAKVDVMKVLERIGSGDNGLKEVIEEVRMLSGDEEARNLLKKKLGAVVFSGYCGKPIHKTSRSTGKQYDSYRDDASLSKHSGLAIIDLDDFKNDEEVKKWKAHFKTDKHVFSVFDSPSGKLKVLYRIPADIAMHRNHYRSILDDLQNMGLKVDSTSINESRVCFMSYDPDIYINEEAVIYTKFMVVNEADVIDDAAIKKGTGMTDFKKVAVAAEMIDRAKDGDKHRTLVKAAYLMGGYIASGLVDENDARKMLRDRIQSKNPNDIELAFGTIEDGLEQGKTKPIYQIEEIENEFKITLSRKQFADEERGFTFLIDRNEVDRKMMDILINGIEMGKAIGIPWLDEYFRLKENNFSVFLGHDNVGKSTLVWWITAVAAAKHGWKWIIYSPENDIAKIKIKLMDFILGRSAKEASQAQLQLVKKFVNEHFYFIRKDKVYTVFDLVKFGQILCQEDPAIKGFLVDPYNSLALDYKGVGAGLSSYEYHTRAISEIRIFSEKFCTVYVNAHSITEARRLKIDDSGNIPRPYKSHIDGGAIWANRADDFYVIHRQVKNPEEFMFTELHVDKIKDSDTGGNLTRGDDEAVKLQFWNGSDFVDPETRLSPLKEWRRDFFGIGEQAKMELPMMNPDEAFI